MIREDWWPTPIWTDQLNVDTTRVAEKCLQLRASGHPNRKFSNIGGWQSTDINLNDHYEFQIIQELLNRKIADLAAAVSPDFTCELNNIWININEKGCRNEKHLHPGSTFSGTIYIQTDENTGNIVFFNDDSASKHYTFLPGDNCNWHYKKVTYKPKNGMIIFFPSWVPHLVQISNSDTPRISMSFNVRQIMPGL